jgi:hypothetical protein
MPTTLEIGFAAKPFLHAIASCCEKLGWHNLYASAESGIRPTGGELNHPNH